jgi:hypothetical protein
MANILFGFGGTILECGAHTGTYEASRGVVKLIRKAQTWQTRDNITRHKFLGYEVQISVKLFNVDADTAVQYYNLVELLNEHNVSGTPVTVTPRYDATLDFGIAFDCTLISDFNPQDIAACSVGQTIDLVFQSTELLSDIPAIFSEMEVFNVIDYTNDTIVDYDDNQIQGVN